MMPKLKTPTLAVSSYRQDMLDAEYMRTLLEQRKDYPKTYLGVREACALYRHNSAYEFRSMDYPKTYLAVRK